MPHTLRPSCRSLAAAALVPLLVVLAACGGGSDEADDGPTTVTMWARSVTAPQSQALVDADNATHEDQVELTVVPFDSYLKKVTASPSATTTSCRRTARTPRRARPSRA